MRTDLPLRNLNRRLRAADDMTEDDPAADDADVPDVPSWVPDGRVTNSQRWLTAIRADPGRSGGIALAVIAVLAVLIALCTLIRDSPAPVVSAKLPAVEMVSSVAARPGAAPTPAPDQPVVVSVVGLVHQPGLVTLAPGSRIADAVRAAGGALDGADTIGLNLAGRVADGQQIVVGVVSPAGQPTSLGSSVISGAPGASGIPGSRAGLPNESSAAATGTRGGPIDLNTASIEQLDRLPGVGPVTAAAIVAWRDEHGKFGTVNDLGDVDGIGPARLEKLRALVTVR